MLGAVPAAAAGQSLPPPPAGFTIVPQGEAIAAMKAQGLMDRLEAEKPSDWDCASALKVKFESSWHTSPGGDRALEYMAQAPQDPARDAMGTRTEPAGKRRHAGGVLEWEKYTTIVAGSDCPSDVVTYHGKWIGYVSGKLIGVSVTHVKSKETGQEWIAAYIDRLKSAVATSR